MPNVTIELPTEKIANIIKKMNKSEKETLSLLLTKQGSELLNRKKDVEDRPEIFLNKNEVFR